MNQTEVMPVSDAQKIDFLVARRFPELRNPRQAVLERKIRFYDSAAAARIDAYREELRLLSTAEVEHLFSEQLAAADNERKAQAEQVEQMRFFHQPNSLANFEYWSRMSHWKLDEAVALTLGREPEFVNWKTIEPLVGVSPFAFEYKRLRELALRAVQWQKLFDPVLPGIYVSWTKEIDIPFPAALECLLPVRGQHVVNWPEAYEAAESRCSALVEHSVQQKEVIDSLVADRDMQLRLKDDTISELVRERDELLAEAERLTTEMKQISSEKPLRTRERDSVLKLIVGMAIRGYSHDPKAARSSTISEIVSDLEELGIPLDADTVRKWIKEGAELLPRDADVSAD